MWHRLRETGRCRRCGGWSPLTETSNTETLTRTTQKDTKCCNTHYLICCWLAEIADAQTAAKAEQTRGLNALVATIRSRWTFQLPARFRRKIRGNLLENCCYGTTSLDGLKSCPQCRKESWCRAHSLWSQCVHRKETRHTRKKESLKTYKSVNQISTSFLRRRICLSQHSPAVTTLGVDCLQRELLCATSIRQRKTTCKATMTQTTSVTEKQERGKRLFNCNSLSLIQMMNPHQALYLKTMLFVY